MSQPSGFEFPMGPAYILHAASIEAPPDEWALLCFTAGDTTVSPQLSTAMMTLDQSGGPVAAFGSWAGEISGVGAAPDIEGFAALFPSTVVLSAGSAGQKGVGLKTATGRIEPRAFCVVPEDEYDEDAWFNAPHAHWLAWGMLTVAPTRTFSRLDTSSGQKIAFPGAPFTIRASGQQALGVPFGMVPNALGVLVRLRASGISGTLPPSISTAPNVDGVPSTFTFFRAGSAVAMQGGVRAVVVEADVPRVETTAAGVRVFRVESTSTNRLLRSTTLSAWNRYGTATVESVVDGAAPFGHYARVEVGHQLADSVEVSASGFNANQDVLPQLLVRGPVTPNTASLSVRGMSGAPGKSVITLPPRSAGWVRLTSLTPGVTTSTAWKANAGGLSGITFVAESATPTRVAFDIAYAGLTPASEGLSSPIETDASAATRVGDGAITSCPGIDDRGVTLHVRLQPETVPVNPPLNMPTVSLSYDVSSFEIYPPGSANVAYAIVNDGPGFEDFFGGGAPQVGGSYSQTLQVFMNGAVPTMRVYQDGVLLAEQALAQYPYDIPDSLVLRSGLFEGVALVRGVRTPEQMDTLVR